MNLCNQIIRAILVFITVINWTAADELPSNSLIETSGLKDDTNVDVNWRQGISSKSTGYYNNNGNQREYSHHLPASHQGYNGYSRTSSRNSVSHSTPIHLTSTGINSYSSLSGSGPGYASSAYSQEYPSPAYPAHTYTSPSISSYPVPNYGPEDLVQHNYDENSHQEKNKFIVKKHLALGITLPLILVPLAVIGILALLNFRAVFTVLVIKSLCSNDAFRMSFGQLCTFVDNINKRSNDDISGFKNMTGSRSHKYSRLMSLLNSARFIAMDRFNEMTEEK